MEKNQFYNSPEDAEIECLIVIPIEFISESGDHILVKYANSASLAQMSLPYVITFCFTAVRKIYFYTRLIVWAFIRTEKENSPSTRQHLRRVHAARKLRRELNCDW